MLHRRALSSRAYWTLFWLALLGLAITFVIAVWLRSNNEFYRHRPLSTRPTAVDAQYSRAFLSSDALPEARYDALFDYFAQGFVDNLDRTGTRVYYPGFPSLRGYDVSGIEGFARTAPLIGARIYSGRDNQLISHRTGRRIDLVELLRVAVTRGTDPDNPGYWGDIGADDQRVIEAAEIARLLWLTREDIWDKLSTAEQETVAAWLSQSTTSSISNRNNWLLFPEIVEAFLSGVGARPQPTYAKYFEFKKNYLENGWFRDGPEGRVDFYNAWGISYDLFWLHLMDPSLDPEFLRASLAASADLTSHLISPQGVPIMGRSICYRTAVASPVIAEALLKPDNVASAGLARRALDVSWRYFIQHNALRDGTLTMGYFESDPRIVDWYTGPGSCHWGLRSLTLAFMAGRDTPFWTTDPSPLPIEQADFNLTFPKLGWIVTGKRDSGDIEIEIPSNTRSTFQVEPYSRLHQASEQVLGRPLRPKNEALKYNQGSYSAVHPLAALRQQTGDGP